jgi:hypothetical protein
VLTNFDQAQHPQSQHTGYVNDPDMLTVGMPGLTDAQARTEMNLWAVSGAPLLAGNNLATMSASTRSILTDRDVIAVDQDPRGLQGVKISEDSPGLQVYGKVLAGAGRRAVVLLNRTTAAAAMTVRWADLGLTSAPAQVRNVWTGATSQSSDYTVTVPAGDSVLVTVAGTEAASKTYVGDFTGIAAGATGLAVADVTYTAATAQTATLKVNGQQPTVVAFPATGSQPRTVSVIVSLAKGTNTLSFTNAPSAITVSPLPGTAGAEVVGAQSGRCLDVDDNGITNGIQAQLWDCAGGPNQTWVSARGQLVVNGGKCLDAYNSGTTNGTAVVIWDCNGGTNQRWNVNADGTITNALSGLCLDAYGNGTANGTKLVLWTCNSGANQRWSLR